ncbi:hypothetical protein [Saccharothrix australiensis]|uniref:Uncharacterized protein n=1 Tax=Saccharothrix australiensis TaxID=2072 RepID=A0A495VZ50_9PSEU|nr:hypothetical protein [Saccharothrix australiensis]RKT53803.1 hypothetical protein C8E97_2385 [Saccharothrix australiensis]
MSSRAGLFPYPGQRALEDAAFEREVTPERIHALLLPVWKVTVQATVVVAEDYDLIDRYLARGLAEAGLATTAELAAFFALEPVLVDRALRALEAIGHLGSADGRWWLTDLGRRSVLDGKRFAVAREDRRELYFDGFGSRPLPRVCYDPRKVTLLPPEDVPADDGVQPLFTRWSFDQAALPALSANPERARFNLPERIDDPRPLGPPELVYLPLLVVRGTTSSGRVTHLAYSQASGEADPDLGALVDATPDITATLDNEHRGTSPEHEEARAREWAERAGLTGHRLVRLPGGLLRVVLPGRHFTGDAAVPLHRLGSFVVRGTGFFQPWCDDGRVRRRALLSRARAQLGAGSRLDAARVRARIARVGRQLDLGAVDLVALRGLAVAAGEDDLVARLDELDQG